MAHASPDRIPLARLMAMAFRALLDRVHQRLRDQGYADVGSTFGYVLLAARDRPQTGGEIAALLGTTKQAASKVIDAMARGGYVRHASHPTDARAKLVTLTRRGRQLLAAVETIYAELEAEWAAEIGAGHLERLRADLTRGVRAMHAGVLPPVRPPG